MTTDRNTGIPDYRGGRPSAISAEYDRPPAPLPAAPTDRKDVWLAKIMKGITLGYSYYCKIDSGLVAGHYLDEVNPQTGASFYPSRTRDASNTYIETVGVNTYLVNTGSNVHWPIPIGTGGVINTEGFPVWVTTRTGGTHHFELPYIPVLARVTAVDAYGWPTQFKWYDYAYLTATHYVRKSAAVPNNYYAYPPAAVDDIISIGFGVSPDYLLGYQRVVAIDLTPRIPIKYSDTKPGSSVSGVYVDSSVPELWTYDNM